METSRDLLLDQLVEYRKQKVVRVTAVFDAARGIHLARSRTNYKGIEVIYSGRDEKRRRCDPGDDTVKARRARGRQF